MRPPNRKAQKDDPDAAYAAAMRLLARREHSAVELRKKLEQREFSAPLIDSAVARLQREGYQSDARFADVLVGHRAGQGYGEMRIRAELAQHRVAAPDVEQALSELGADWTERAAQQARRHFALPPQGPADAARALRHLVQRGFPSDVARRGLERWRESVQEPG